MLLKNLEKDDVFHFEDDNDETELIVIFESETIVQFDSLSQLNSTSLCINKEWDYMGKREVVKLYNKSN